jgi:hypothetical protein
MAYFRLLCGGFKTSAKAMATTSNDK